MKTKTAAGILAAAAVVTGVAVKAFEPKCAMRPPGVGFDACLRLVPAGKQLPPRPTLTHVQEGVKFPASQAQGDCLKVACE